MLLNPSLTVPKTKIEVSTKSYVDKKFIDPSIMKNTAHVDFNDKNLDNVEFKKKQTAFLGLENIWQEIIMLKKLFFRV